MKYGYCGDPSIQWKLEYGNGQVGVGLFGKLNTTLVRTIRYTHPRWYYKREYTSLKAWIDALMCPGDLAHIPSNASLSIQLLEQYRWRPKDATPRNGDIINYNAPCLTSQRRRKGLRLNYNCNLKGKGAIDRDVFMGACPLAETFLEDLSGIEIAGIWTHNACSIERPINDWESFSTGARANTGSPYLLPEWTQMSVSVSSLNLLQLSVLDISEVQYFPDQHPSDVDINSVEETLATQAGVYNCPR